MVDLTVTTLNRTFSHEGLTLYFKIFDFLRLIEGKGRSEEDLQYIKALAQSEYNLPQEIYNLALSEKQSVDKFFSKVIHKAAYSSQDSRLFESFLENWYTSLRTFSVYMKKGIDPFNLSNSDLDLLIKSFGFPYSNKIISRRLKISFLYHLIEYYHRKGTPYAFGGALEHFGLKDLVILTWWLKRDRYGNLVFESDPIYPRSKKDDSSLVSIVDYDDFELDQHWHMTKEYINSIYPNKLITLPSITPYITLINSYDICKIKTGIAILQDWLQETYEFWLEYVLQYKGIITSIENTPPVTPSGTYLVGSNPTGIFIGKSNRYATYSNNSWSFSVPKRDDIVYVTYLSKHHVYNGTDWINLGTVIPSKYLNNDKFGKLNRNVNLTNFEDLRCLLEIMLAVGYLFDSLNSTTDSKLIKYKGKYSPLDQYTIIKKSDSDEDKKESRDNILDDSEVYGKIYEEWDSVNVDPKTRDERDLNYSYITNNFEDDIGNTPSELLRYDLNEDGVFDMDDVIFLFTKIFEGDTDINEHPTWDINEDGVIDVSDVTELFNILNGGYKYLSFFGMYNYPNIFLEAMCPEFKEELDNYILGVERVDILRYMILDLEDYLYDISNMFQVPFSSLLFGFSFYEDYKNIIEFFKPYRVRILSFSTGLSIFDRVGDKILNKDENSRIVTFYFGDQAPGGHGYFDFSTITDSCEVIINSV